MLLVPRLAVYFVTTTTNLLTALNLFLFLFLFFLFPLLLSFFLASFFPFLTISSASPLSPSHPSAPPPPQFLRLCLFYESKSFQAPLSRHLDWCWILVFLLGPVESLL